MNEREKKILKTISLALPNMTEFDKGYFLGVAESKVSDNRESEQPICISSKNQNSNLMMK